LNIVFILVLLIGLAVVGIVVFFASTSDPKKLYSLAAEAYKKKDWNAVIKYSVKLSLVDQMDPLPHYYLGVAYKNKELYPNSLKYLSVIYSKSLQNKVVRDEMLYNELAEVYLKLKDFEKAIKFFKLVLTIDAKHCGALYNLGKINFDTGNYKAAIVNLEECLGIDRSYSKAFGIIGIAYFNLNNYQEAYKYLKAAEKIGSHTEGIDYFIAECLYLRAAFDESIEYYKKSFEKKINPWESLSKIAQIYAERGSVNKAIENYEKLLQDDSAKGRNIADINEARYQLAALFRQLGIIEKAISLWSAISKTDPGYKDVGDKLKSFSFVEEEKGIIDIYRKTPEEFLEIAKAVVLSMKHKLRNTQVIDRETVEILSVYTEKNAEVDCLSAFHRGSGTVGDLEIRAFAKKIREDRIYKGQYFSLTSFSEGAHEACITSPVDLYDGKQVANLIKKIK